MNITILAVDDSPLIRDIIKSTLDTGEYESEFAANGAEGLEKFKNGKFDLVVTDINMPVMGGIEFIQKLRSFNREVPIVVLSTVDDSEIVEQGQAAGVNGWVVKPIIEDQFLELLSEILAIGNNS